jgi:uncharacterized protein (TIGR02145 family)/prepilin-type N-terminal cleavage/methylation domain-containing protein
MHKTGMRNNGFTIIELTIVIVVIGILAAISVVGYGSWRTGVAKAEVQSDLKQAAAAMESARNFGNTYPLSIPASFTSTATVTVTYTSGDATSFCIDGVSNVVPTVSYFVSSTNKVPVLGTCTGGPGGGGSIASGDPIQTVTAANCPTALTMVVDSRDNRTYWINKLADGKCWMLTNLAYAGGGTNTYGDVINFTNPAAYTVPTGANPTTSPTLPSASTNGTGQYGYLYNYCAALGAQVSTFICNIAGTMPPPSGTITVCPSGWRLPIRSGGTSEYTGLNNAINGGSTTSGTNLKTTWLGQFSGIYDGSTYTNQGLGGYYWIDDASNGGGSSYNLVFQDGYVNTLSVTTGGNKYAAARCIAR